MSTVVATLTLDPKNRTIHDLKIHQRQFKFKCKRKATLCCKLGGPVLTRKDETNLKFAGYYSEEFLEPPRTPGKNLLGRLKTRPDGSCIFLNYDKTKNQLNCGIYDCRPSLCRLYPFTFELLGSNCVVVKLIPCCLGLNNPEGKIFDKNFFETTLLEPLLDAIKLRQKRVI